MDKQINCNFQFYLHKTLENRHSTVRNKVQVLLKFLESKQLERFEAVENVLSDLISYRNQNVKDSEAKYCKLIAEYGSQEVETVKHRIHSKQYIIESVINN